MCSGFWDIDWKSFYEEEAAFNKELKEKWIIEDNKKPKNIEWVVDEGKGSIDEIVANKKDH